MSHLVHVELPGHGTFWVSDQVLHGKGDSPLAPEEHVEDGRLKMMFPIPDAYAHVFEDGRIKRHGRRIGDVKDLVRI